MKTLTGKLFNIVPLVVGGNTIHVFCLGKERLDDRAWGDPKVYAAVFVTPQPKGDGQPSDLALQLACLPENAVVEVTIEDIEGDVPIGIEADAKRRLTVITLAIVPRPRGV